MKYLYVSISLLLIVDCLFAQLKFTVSTDKIIYQYGENIYITVTAVNNNTIADTLSFATCQQANYMIDSFNWADSLGWCAAGTYRIISPHDSTIWGNSYFGYRSEEHTSELQ